MTTPLEGSNERPRPTETRSRVISTPSNRSAAAYHSDQSPSRPSTRRGQQAHNQHRHSPHAQFPAQKKKQQGGKKNGHPDQASQHSLDGANPTHPSLTSPSINATPLKQAYAGPTFHSSPAASSLPLPSFFTKSLSTVAASPPSKPGSQLDGGEASAESEGETVSAQAKASLQAQREPSPLDFMFEAARRARDTPKSQSPAHPTGRPSPFDETPRAGSHTPGDTSSDSGFPFELDGNGGSMPIGPAFATPYRDRMAALKPSQPEPNGLPQVLDEKERREKSEALKRLLANASPRQMQDSIDAPSYDRPGNPYSTGPTPRQISGGTLSQPIPFGPSSHSAQINPANPPMSEPPYRSGSSRLSREYLPDNYHIPAELDSDPGTPSRMAPRSKKPVDSAEPNGFADHSPEPKVVTKRAKASYSSQELEDDLRRVLKLDMTPSR